MPPKKDSSLLSTNKHTQNELQRRANKSGFDKKLLQLKRANQGKIDYQAKKVKATDRFAAGDEAEQKRMLAESKEQIIAKL